MRQKKKPQEKKIRPYFVGKIMNYKNGKLENKFKVYIT